MKVAEPDSMGRKRVYFRGKLMRYGTAMKMAAMEPLIYRAKSNSMSIPRTAEWMGWSESALRQWIATLGVKWDSGVRKRKVYKHDRTGWDDHILNGLKGGKSLVAIGKELGVGHWMVCRHAKEKGLWSIVLKQIPSDK